LCRGVAQPGSALRSGQEQGRFLLLAPLFPHLHSTEIQQVTIRPNHPQQTRIN
jgi:hypothetical protein